jgi:hypothetical protein
MVGTLLSNLMIDTAIDPFSAKAVTKLLKAKEIDFVRIQWVDYCNMIVDPYLDKLTAAIPSLPTQTVSLIHQLSYPQVGWYNEGRARIDSNRYNFTRLQCNGGILSHAGSQKYSYVHIGATICLFHGSI